MGGTTSIVSYSCRFSFCAKITKRRFPPRKRNRNRKMLVQNIKNVSKRFLFCRTVNETVRNPIHTHFLYETNQQLVLNPTDNLRPELQHEPIELPLFTGLQKSVAQRVDLLVLGHQHDEILRAPFLERDPRDD